MDEQVNRRSVSAERIRTAVARATRASAKLEGREAPEGYVRSNAVQGYIDQRRAGKPPRE